jgi:carbonic anhydrase
MCPAARHQWLTSVILATQKAKIKRIVVLSHPRQRVQVTLSQKKNQHKKGLVEWLKV